MVWDTHQRGLAVQVQPTGRKSWKCIYSFHGRPRWYYIGDVASIDLSDARKLAGRVTYRVAEGADPCAEKKAERSKGTFAELTVAAVKQDAAIVVDLAEAARFLAALDPDAKSFTFQTFDDVLVVVDGKLVPRKDPALVRVRHGTLAQHAAELQRLNENGAGIFVTVSETNGKGRKAENITRARALFVDLEGAPLDPVLAYERKPHIVTETSPRRWHAFWRVADIKLEEFAGLQKSLIERFGADKSVHDLPRVMRLPGFVHRKITPGHSGTQHVKNGIHDLAVVNPRTLATLRQQRLKQRPFFIAEIKSHDPPPRTVNHVRSNYSIIYLGTDPSNSHLRRPTMEQTSDCSCWILICSASFAGELPMVMGQFDRTMLARQYGGWYLW